MKILKFLKLFLLLIVLASCSSLSGFAPKKGATGEEFLIQKKNALVMPPDYMIYQLHLKRLNHGRF